MTILKDLFSAQKRAGVRSEDQISIPHPDEIQDILENLGQGSPKLRFLLLIIAELVILKQEKMLVFVTLLAQQTWLECVSQATLRSKAKGYSILSCTLPYGFVANGYRNLLHVLFADASWPMAIEVFYVYLISIVYSLFAVSCSLQHQYY